jgi:hypothetical protein
VNAGEVILSGGAFNILVTNARVLTVKFLRFIAGRK